MAAFYSVCATAAAALIGLLFVAVQLGPPLVPTGPLRRRHAIARSTFTIFGVIFGLSLYLMAPGPSLENHVIAAIIAATGGSIRAVRTWLPVWRDKLQGRVEFRLLQTAWLLIGPLLAYAYLITGAVSSARRNDGTVLDLNAEVVFIVLFAIAIRNSWNLLIEARPTDGSDHRGS
jgi:hypothetical protein